MEMESLLTMMTMWAGRRTMSKLTIVCLLVLSTNCLSLTITRNSHPRAALTSLKFTADLYSILRNTDARDVFFSPFSISLALTMLNEGARGNSTAQIRRALGLSSNDNEIHSALEAIMKSIKTNKGNVTLDVAAKLYAHERDFELNQEFNDTLVKTYGAGIERLNFGQSEAARKQINGWIEEVTREKIKDLLPPGSINDATKLVMANAIYFKGDWAQKFDKDATGPVPFHTSPFLKNKVDMMRITDDFYYIETDDAYAVDLPYEGDKVFMTVVVPKERFGLTAIEEKLDEKMLHNLLWEGRTRSGKVNLSMPKFKMETSFGLRKFLAKIGITDVFDPASANLTGISENPLFLDEGFHKAFIEVNEDGAEAAASTGEKNLHSIPLVIPGDEPFIFFIKHKPSKMVLFMGKLTDG